MYIDLADWRCCGDSRIHSFRSVWTTGLSDVQAAFRDSGNTIEFPVWLHVPDARRPPAQVGNIQAALDPIILLIILRQKIQNTAGSS